VRHVGWPLGQIFRGLPGDWARLWSLVEQGLLSAANFAAMLLLARKLDSATFGTFSFAWLTLQFVINIHRSAVVVPFVIHTAAPGVMEAESGVWARLNLAITVLTVAVLAGIGGGLPMVGGAPWLGQAFLMAAVLVPHSFAYEFRRRGLIQRERYGSAVGAAAVYGAVVVGMCAANSGLVGVVLAFATANAAAWVVTAAAAATNSSPAQSTAFVPFLRRQAHFIGWSVLSNLAFNGYYHVPPLLLGVLAGPVPVGAFQALRTFMQPLATVATAVDNFDKPRAARALASGGGAGLRRALTGTTAAMGLFSAPYVVAMVAAGPALVDVVYGGRYGDSQAVLNWLAGMHVATIAAYPVETALYVIRRPDLVFLGRLAAAAAGIGVAALAIPRWGVVGAVAGLIMGILLAALAAVINLQRMKKWQNPA
jgi:O-antigen/teichoic acid export membrane protein